jgi:hypothetical protein
MIYAVLGAGVTFFVCSVFYTSGTPLDATQQRGAQGNPRNESTSEQAASNPIALIAPTDPSPYTGEEARKYNEAYIATQRDIAQASRQTAAYTYALMWIGSGVGVLEIVLIGFQALYTGRAAKAASNALVMTNRPRLLVRPITLDGFSDNGMIQGKLTCADQNQQRRGTG